MADRLGIHVLGPRYGESVVLELPDGGVGVIDSFAAADGPHPVVEFLAATFPRLSGLRFFALTHPHADHCFRAAEILQRYWPEEFWSFHPFPSGQTVPYFAALARHGGSDRVEAALGLPVGSVADSLLQLHARVRRPIKDGRLGFRYLMGGQASVRFCSGRLEVHWLTPIATSQFAYADDVEQAARRIVADGPALRASNRLPQVDHNRTSGAILLVFGRTRALLMADAEAPRWEEWLATDPPAELRRPVHFLKAAHHGSPNGHHPPLYAACADPALTVAVMTPFNHGSVHLPTAVGASAVRGCVNALYCTNRGLARASTSLDWQPVHPSSTVRPPRKWTLMIDRTPALRWLLVDSGTPPAALLPLPKTWASDAAAKPELLRSLRPEVRPPSTPVPAGLTCVVSAYYNNRGERVELRVGDDAGRLP